MINEVCGAFVYCLGGILGLSDREEGLFGLLVYGEGEMRRTRQGVALLLKLALDSLPPKY